MKKQGVNLGNLLMLEQFQHAVSLTNKLLIQKSVRAGRDLVYEFGLHYLDSVTDTNDKAKPTKSKGKDTSKTEKGFSDIYFTFSLAEFLA